VPNPSPAFAPAPVAGRRARGCLIEVVETVVLTLVIFLGIQTFVAQPFRVEGGSMETTVLPDQYILIDRLTPRWAPYARGDIVVLHPPSLYADPNGTPFIKRVIGLPGDRIELQGGNVYVNGKELDEPYLFAVRGVRQPTNPTAGAASEWLVPAGELFVMGDHRRASADSRAFGPIEISQVIGRAWLRYWPIDVFGILPAAKYPT
jgi:signal peptidase I